MSTKTREKLVRVVANGVRTGALKPREPEGRTIFGHTLSVVLTRGVHPLLDNITRRCGKIGAEEHWLVVDASGSWLKKPAPDPLQLDAYVEELVNRLALLTNLSDSAKQNPDVVRAIHDTIREIDRVLSMSSDLSTLDRDVVDGLLPLCTESFCFTDKSFENMTDDERAGVHESLGRIREMAGMVDSYALEHYMLAGGVPVEDLYLTSAERRDQETSRLKNLLSVAVGLLDVYADADAAAAAMTPERRRMFDNVMRFCLCMPTDQGYLVPAITIAEKAPPLVLE